MHSGKHSPPIYPLEARTHNPGPHLANNQGTLSFHLDLHINQDISQTLPLDHFTEEK